ncbi:hypothetical protein ACSXAY_19060 (plasmid) [Clostridium perfringens]
MALRFQLYIIEISMPHYFVIVYSIVYYWYYNCDLGEDAIY